MVVQEKKVILITGSSSGFGRLTAETLAKDGHVVYASLRNAGGRNKGFAKELEKFAQVNNASLKVIEIDVTKTNSIDKAVKQIIKEQGRIDVLVNNAGTLYAGITEAFTDEQAYEQINTNFLGVVRCNRAVLPYMRKQESGLLVHISSILGRVIFPFFGIYSASKYALEALAETYRYELSSFGVDSVLIEPGPFETEIGKKLHVESDAATRTAYGAVGELQGKIFGAVGDILSKGQVANPQQVADAIKQLIDTPSGQRPLRTVVGEDFYTQQVNENVDVLQAKVLSALSVSGLAKVKTKTKA
jgi:NAD(P)-dependent dehydrogenase (short-subunit alcohol dehydrogenase family)